MLFLIISFVTNGLLSAKAIFAQKKNYFAIFEKTKVAAITFRLR